ncbi:SRPBCC family protein [Streptomyces griseofuscus]|uniref:SRPBCC family protein n=1 Tax=Streptomyces griseofuscus TaxID=146922 RepID=UPI00369A151E
MTVLDRDRDRGRGRHAEEHTPVAASSATVYGILSEMTAWPLLLPYVVHAEPLPRCAGHVPGTRTRIWAVQDGRFACWVSRRRYDTRRRRIDFACTTAEGAAGEGAWTVTPDGDGRCVLRVRHRLGPVPAGVMAPLLRAVRRRAEERERGELTVSRFSQETPLQGPPEVALDFLHRAENWPGRAGEVVQAAEVEEPVPGTQLLTLRTPHGRTVRSARLCFPHAGRLVHRQTSSGGVPGAAGHTGEWSVLPGARGAVLRARHTVLLHHPPGAAAPGDVAGELARAARVLADAARRCASSAGVRML